MTTHLVVADAPVHRDTALCITQALLATTFLTTGLTKAHAAAGDDGRRADAMGR
jgi:hypothetical protein